LAQHASEFNTEEIVDLLAPTRLYHDVVGGLRSAGIRPKAMAHITGGGLPENLERLLGGKAAHLTIPQWNRGAVQKVLSHCDPADCFNTFNMGIGWVALVAPADVDAALGVGPGGRLLGTVEGESGHVSVVIAG
jgi:phosphoribosylformylglycinamidine cyclo-ligase